MDRLIIDDKSFELKNFNLGKDYQSSRPTVDLTISASYDEIYNIAKDGLISSTVIIDSESQSGAGERIDISMYCDRFEKLINVKNEYVILTMSGFSDIELLQSVIDDLLVSSLK